jgi:flagellar FliL protein
MKKEASPGLTLAGEGHAPRAGSSISSLVAALLLGFSAGASLPLTGVLAGPDGALVAANEAAALPLDASARTRLSYIPMDPPFVVNFSGSTDIRFLQVAVEAGTHDPAVVERVRAQRPAIRDRLVMLFSNQEPGELDTREGKEKLRGEALSEIRKVMMAQTGTPGVDSVFFTNFVMQ